jgi:uncharacterized protein with HEPN domain
MRSDTVLVIDILDAAHRVSEYVGDIDYGAFVSNRMLQAAVQHEILIMGEAASKVSQEFKERHVTIAWAELIQLRNFYIHAYHRVDTERLWKTLNGLVRDVERKLARLIQPEEPQAQG